MNSTEVIDHEFASLESQCEDLAGLFQNAGRSTNKFLSTLELCFRPDFCLPDELLDVRQKLLSETTRYGRQTHRQLAELIKRARNSLLNFRVVDPSVSADREVVLEIADECKCIRSDAEKLQLKYTQEITAVEEIGEYMRTQLLTWTEDQSTSAPGQHSSASDIDNPMSINTPLRPVNIVEFVLRVSEFLVELYNQYVPLFVGRKHESEAHDLKLLLEGPKDLSAALGDQSRLIESVCGLLRTMATKFIALYDIVHVTGDEGKMESLRLELDNAARLMCNASKEFLLTHLEPERTLYSIQRRIEAGRRREQQSSQSLIDSVPAVPFV